MWWIKLMSEKLIREDSPKSYANTYIFEGINESDNIFLFLGCGNYFWETQI